MPCNAPLQYPTMHLCNAPCNIPATLLQFAMPSALGSSLVPWFLFNAASILYSAQWEGSSQTQGTPRDLPRNPKDLPRSPRGPPSTPQDLSEELWDLLSLPEYSQELFEELWTRLMTAKARSHTYRQPVPTQNWFNYIVLIQKYTLLIKK